MPVNIFITGITGYIGGDAFYAIQKAHPEYEWTALVREHKADLIKKAYPKVRIVTGELDDYDTIKKEALRADIVIHTADASDHEKAANAIAEGLVEGHSKDNPGFWLHTGGTGILTYEDSNAGNLGVYSDKEYNDWDGVDELVKLPDEAFHRKIDKIVLKTGKKHNDAVKTAIICPPTIYGKGRGPSLVRGRQVYELAKLVLEAQYTPIVGEGKARWNYVHIYDLANVFLLLTEAAAAKKSDDGLWGDKGYFLTENGEHMWSDLARDISAKAKELGYIHSTEEKPLSKDAAMEQAGFEAVSWGLNSRAKSERARNLLGWLPAQPSIFDEVTNIVKDEKERLDGEENKGFEAQQRKQPEAS